ncbi:hypothetical protein YC2023_039365 [Brassica napus]
MGEHNRNPFAIASASGNAGGGSTSASSDSSFSSSVADTDDDQTIARMLAEDESLRREQGKLGRRLSHLGSIPHTPRVNRQIPDVNDATLDHELLSGRLATYGLAELQMEGDGNCQFRALADQLFRNADYHKHVRKHVVKQTIAYSSLKLCFPLSLSLSGDLVFNHLWLMKFPTPLNLRDGYKLFSDLFFLLINLRPGEWGDHVTLQAAADRFEAKICLVTSFREQSYIEILPHNKNPLRVAWLSYWSEVHYNSLYSVGDVPTRKPKKKHWLF